MLGVAYVAQVRVHLSSIEGLSSLWVVRRRGAGCASALPLPPLVNHGSWVAELHFQVTRVTAATGQ